LARRDAGDGRRTRPRLGRVARRPRDAVPGARQGVRDVPPAAAGARRASPAAQGDLRPARDPQPPPPLDRVLMQTNLAPAFRGTPDGEEADAILRACVHCGFCTATCPTYQLLGDELDGPRGRIYLIKQVLEGAPVSAKTQLHLDR